MKTSSNWNPSRSRTASTTALASSQRPHVLREYIRTTGRPSTAGHPTDHRASSRSQALTPMRQAWQYASSSRGPTGSRQLCDARCSSWGRSPRTGVGPTRDRDDVRRSSSSGGEAALEGAHRNNRYRGHLLGTCTIGGEEVVADVPNLGGVKTGYWGLT